MVNCPACTMDAGSMAEDKRNFSFHFHQGLNCLMKMFQAFYIHVKGMFFVLTFRMHIAKIIVGCLLFIFPFSVIRLILEYNLCEGPFMSCFKNFRYFPFTEFSNDRKLKHLDNSSYMFRVCNQGNNRQKLSQ